MTISSLGIMLLLIMGMEKIRDGVIIMTISSLGIMLLLIMGMENKEENKGRSNYNDNIKPWHHVIVNYGACK